MTKFHRVEFIPNMGVSLAVNEANRLQHERRQDHLEWRHDIAEKAKAAKAAAVHIKALPPPQQPKPQPTRTQTSPKTPPVEWPTLTYQQEQALIRGVKKTAKILGITAGIGIGGFFAISLVGMAIEKVKDTYHGATTWVHKTIDPAWVDPAPKQITATPAPAKPETAKPAKKAEPAVTKPAQPVKKAPPVSVFKRLPEGVVVLPDRKLYIDAVSDMISYTMAQSGSKKMDQAELYELAENIAAAGPHNTFTRGLVDNSTGETLEIIVGAVHQNERQTVLCLGSKQGIRSVTSLNMIATPQNISVAFSNNVISSTNGNIDLTAIANRASQCHQVMLELHKIDPRLRFAL